MAFQIPISIPEQTNECIPETITEDQIVVSDFSNSVSKSHMRKIVEKVAGILAAQGVPCCDCPKTRYILYELSDCKETTYRFSLNIGCMDENMSYRFELLLSPVSPAEHGKQIL